MATTIWTVLSDDHRRALLDELVREPASVGELSQRVKLSQPQTSKHLRVLREAGLVTVHPSAQRRIYRVRAHALSPLDEWLTPYRLLWNDRLGDHLDSALSDADVANTDVPNTDVPDTTKEK